MAEQLMEMMKRIAVFTVVAQTILHFRPNKSYEKYLKMLIGIMLLAIFTVPLMELFQENSIREYELLLEGYEKSIDRMYETSDFTLNLKEETYLYTLEEEIKDRFNIISKNYDYTVETVNLSGVSDLYEDNGKADVVREGCVEVTLKARNDGISTVQVDKIKLQGDKTKSVSNEIPEDGNKDMKMLRSLFAESIGIPEKSVRIILKSA